MPRILFGVTHPQTANAFLIPQLNNLISDGWEVHLACSPETSFLEIERIHGLSLHLIPMRRTPTIFRDLVSLYRWCLLVKTVKPDIVVGGTPKAGLLSMLSSKFNSVPARVYHARGFRAEGLSGFRKTISLVTEKLSTALATEVLCDSFTLRDALRKMGCLGQTRGIVLGSGSCCGVNVGYFRPPSLEEKIRSRKLFGYEDDQIVIGFVGRVAEDKGVRELAQAIAMVSAEHEDVRLALIGPDEGGLSLIREHLTNKHVTYFGPTSDVRAAYWAFDAFALPSYREGFPIAALEAQSCALTLITTSATGCTDSQSSRNPLLTVPVKSPTSLARAIEYVVTREPIERLFMGEQARSWVNKNFNEDSVTRNHVDFYSKQI